MKTKVKQFQRALLHWYKKHGRNLPWRKTTDPYKILVSEMMLQQTQVDRVIEKYKSCTVNLIKIKLSLFSRSAKK